MIVIPIQSKKYGEKYCFIDGEDFDKVKDYTWGLKESSKNNLYVVTYKNKKIIRLHRLLTNCPDGLFVDHKDFNTLNNCKSNLRICTHAENGRNNKIKNIKKTSKYKGVCWKEKQNKYSAQIMYKDKSIHLGYFTDEKEAAFAYNTAAQKYFKEYSCLNVIE